ncbi:hypothetical protein [Bdellovibrio sp. HCB288]|uniref:hypothetical protein n=1 Tax=Bdellovibrio sp. HCB288 TaxID=3394355 RepID=UPI0039B44B62
MEGVAPPLALLLCVKRALEKGQPTKVGVMNYLKRHQGDFPSLVGRWLALLQQGKVTHGLINQSLSPHRQVLLQLLERGIRGEAIYNVIVSLEEEMLEACEDDIRTKLTRLPFLLLIPLLLFQFPAFLLLLFGPLLQNFFHSLGGG